MPIIKKNSKKALMANIKKTNLLEVPWNLIDVLLIFLILPFSLSILFLLIQISIERLKIEYGIFIFLFPLLEISLAYFWLKKKYNSSWGMLGIRKGRYSLGISIAIGIFSAFSIILIVSLIPCFNESILKNNSINSINYFLAFFVLFTPLGFARFIIGPFCEEILFRGILFGYLRTKMGLIKSILLQAFISTLMHPIQVINFFQDSSFSKISYMFIINIILGLLYQKVDNIYPSTICHGALNNLIFLYTQN